MQQTEERKTMPRTMNPQVPRPTGVDDDKLDVSDLEGRAPQTVHPRGHLDSDEGESRAKGEYGPFAIGQIVRLRGEGLDGFWQITGVHPTGSNQYEFTVHQEDVTLRVPLGRIIGTPATKGEHVNEFLDEPNDREHEKSASDDPHVRCLEVIGDYIDQALDSGEITDGTIDDALLEIQDLVAESWQDYHDRHGGE
jgi:hypothetical protein